ncbi:hypothetical protein GOP47_0006947 [Adiantum capillus-veneris]|uniref:Dirigent protein n=1 Tax=Adiantum capillus-veneris TaxID=13818 RepID=A0A9D4ZIQ8_ADICA|nr:hypothetical protein GOP47_0006947 [Adiantum capillus-veneris]
MGSSLAHAQLDAGGHSVRTKFIHLLPAQHAYNPVVNNKDNFTSVYGVPPNVTWPNPYAFDTTSTFEDPLTIVPSITLPQIGIAHGFRQLDNKIDYMLFNIFTANIIEGDYKGTINIFGRFREANPVHYMSVIHGTGTILGARGLATCLLVTIDRTPPAKWTLSFDLDLYY